MTLSEKRSTFYLASIYALRMFGLFIILPIFSLYTQQYQYANASLIGLALGIYGLTQAILQIPFGMCSDHIGRKPVIVFGLVLFIIGSITAACSHSIYGVIIGRALQGSGAIGSTLTAMVADMTQEENRLKAMTIIGMTIGISFTIAMILGPILNTWIGLTGIFWLTALLAFIGILVLLFLIPTPKNHLFHSDSEPALSLFKSMLTNSQLLRLDLGIFCLHGILMALFVVLPTLLLNHTGISVNQQWIIYLPVLFLAFIFMTPFVIISETKRLMKPFFIGAVVLLTLTQLLLASFHQHIFIIAILLCLFFTAFTFLEASLPSLISKIAPAGSKGTAMGIYSNSQFLGIFVGGTLGGAIMHYFGLTGLFFFSTLLGSIYKQLEW